MMKYSNVNRFVITIVLILLSGHSVHAQDISGTVYADFPDYSQTDLFQRYSGRDFGLPDVYVHLFDKSGNSSLAKTDADGDYTFKGLQPASYFVFAEIPKDAESCTSHNNVVALREWFKKGSIKYVTFGDSTTVYGDPVPYPSRLNSMLQAFFNVDFNNVGVSGSTTSDWLPGTNSYYDKNVGLFKDADLIVVSLGGNDLAGGAQDYDINEAKAAMKQAEINIGTILSALRTLNHGAVIVVTIYPNYSLADQYWLQYVSSDWIGLIQVGMDAMIRDMRTYLSNIPYVILADCYMSFKGLDMNDYMHDPIHPNGNGHQLYAETVFSALGGVVVTNDTVSVNDFGFSGAFKPSEPDHVEADTAESLEQGDFAQADVIEPAQDMAIADTGYGEPTGTDIAQKDSVSIADASVSDLSTEAPNTSGAGCSSTHLPYPANTGWVLLFLIGLVLLKVKTFK